MPPTTLSISQTLAEDIANYIDTKRDLNPLITPDDILVALAKIKTAVLSVKTDLAKPTKKRRPSLTVVNGGKNQP